MPTVYHHDLQGRAGLPPSSSSSSSSSTRTTGHGGGGGIPDLSNSLYHLYVAIVYQICRALALLLHLVAVHPKSSLLAIAVGVGAWKLGLVSGAVAGLRDALLEGGQQKKQKKQKPATKSREKEEEAAEGEEEDDEDESRLLPPSPHRQLLGLFTYVERKGAALLDFDGMAERRLGEQEISLRASTDAELNRLSGPDAAAERMAARNALDAAALRALRALGVWQGFVELRPRPCLHNIYTLNLLAGNCGKYGLSRDELLSSDADWLWSTVQTMTGCSEREPENLRDLMMMMMKHAPRQP